MTSKQDRETSRAEGAAGTDLVPDTDRILAGLDLGQRLALARQQRGLTQKQLSELVGKSRATIVQYEQGRLQPPLQQIEIMSRVLEVAPELIAFGRQGITGLASASANVASLPEIQIEGGYEVVTGGHGLGKALADHLRVSTDDAGVYVLGQPAPAFGLAAGDRVIVNSGTDLDQENRLYALRTASGIAVARLLPVLSGSARRVSLNGGHGETLSYDPGELSVLGVVVGSIQAR